MPNLIAGRQGGNVEGAGTVEDPSGRAGLPKAAREHAGSLVDPVVGFDDKGVSRSTQAHGSAPGEVPPIIGAVVRMTVGMLDTFPLRIVSGLPSEITSRLIGLEVVRLTSRVAPLVLGSINSGGWSSSASCCWHEKVGVTLASSRLAARHRAALVVLA